MQAGDIIQWNGLNGEVVAVVRELSDSSLVAVPVSSKSGTYIPVRDLEMGRVKLKLISSK